ncbi:MAG: mttA/Hcf106 family-domain-containing protein [Monoraphidium minutum]|nr:MAG: mttA/Hcf106 family-domain-containing protein [Monoraphidium minutum]
MAASMHRGMASIGRAPARVARPATGAQIRVAPFRTPSAQPFVGSPRQQHQQRHPVACRGLFGLGVPELVVIAGVAALIFGPSKLPELGKGLGKTVKSFQTAAKEFETELKQAAGSDEEKKDGAAPAAPGATAAAKAEDKKE